MFRKILIFAMFATAAGYCFASDNLKQIVTSEVFYDQEIIPVEEIFVEQEQIPAWPLIGSEADVEVGCNGNPKVKQQDDNIRIVSKIGDDLVVENNFNIGARGGFGGWSGGANMLHGTQIPVGFDDECLSGTEMPLLHREVLEDDGGNVLAVSRSGRRVCSGGDDYNAFALRNNMNTNFGSATNVKKVVLDNGVAIVTTDGKNVVVSMGDGSVTVSGTGAVSVNGTSQITQQDGNTVATSADGSVVVTVADSGARIVVSSYESEVVLENGVIVAINGNSKTVEDGTTDFALDVETETSTSQEEIEVAVDVSADAEAPIVVKDQVRSWVVVSGQTLREVLKTWADKEGWDLVWTTPREYPIEASAVFKGRFVDVAAALVRNFGRATPVPYAKFYKGNRVLVISTVEE